MASSLENTLVARRVDMAGEALRARHFDIDWVAPTDTAFLGDTFDAVLENGEVRQAHGDRYG